ncbi:hypothetical protein ACHWQZ_G011262 [Mnemiopsis leidyi]
MAEFNADADISQLVLLASGSFDPITNYHIRIFELVRQYFTLKGCVEGRAIISLTPKTTNTNPDCSETQDRIKMCELATSNIHNLVIDEWEYNQRCYTILPKVINKLADKYCSTGDTIAVMITEEQVSQITQWPQSEVDELMMNKNVVCVTPNPHRLINVVQFCSKFSTYEDNFHVIIDHGNTVKPNIRQAVANEQSIEGLVAPQVAKYIAEHFLYKESEKEIECSHIALQMSPKSRILLPRIRNTANSSSNGHKKKKSQTPKMGEFLKIQRMSKRIPS